jgi:hypothetical protein
MWGNKQTRSAFWLLICADFFALAFYLLFIVQWDLSWEEAQRIGQDASKNFKYLDPQDVDLAIQVHPLSS